MAKWTLPHEMESAPELIAPRAASPRFILPNEQLAQEEAQKSPAQQTLEESPKLERALIGAGERFHDIGLAAKQKAGQVYNLLPGQKTTLPQEVSEQLRNEAPFRQAIAEDPYAGYGKAGADVALGMLSPSTRMLPAMATGATLGALTPQENSSFGDTMVSAGKGALLGGLGQVASNSLIGTVARGKNAMQGRFASPDIERRYRIFQQNGVPASLGDLTQNPGVMGIENMAQYIPGSGRRQFMENQANQLSQVVEGAPERIAGNVTARSKEDIGNVLADSIKAKYGQVKNEAKQLYDSVENKVMAVGNPPVTPVKTSSEVNALLNKYPTAFARLSDDPDTVNALTTIAKGTSPKSSQILDAKGLPVQTAPQLTFSELRQLDSDLGSMIRQGRQLTTRGELSNKSFDQLVKVQKALREDITDWSKQVGDPEIATGIAEANKFFRERVTPFRKNQLVRKVIQDEQYNPDTLAKSMFKLDSPHLSSQAVEFLTPEGIQAGRFHLLNQAKEKAVNDALTSGYSPSQFLRGSELGETGPKLFNPMELGELDDLQELLRSSRRAAGYAADPSTGNRLLGLAPLVSWKAPLAAKLFSTATTSEKPMQFMLANPNLYTGAGGLGRMAESMTRKSGTGLGLDINELLNQAPE